MLENKYIQQITMILFQDNDLVNATNMITVQNHATHWSDEW
jgi:hypothetical protein